MARFLSPEWIAALDEAASSNDSLRDQTGDVAFVIQETVKDGPDGDAAWFVTVDHGTVRVQPGQADHADVSFTQDHATAIAIGRGEMSAQAAFMIGKLRVGGDVQLLIEHQDAFDGVEDVFAPVRASTEY